MKKARYRIDMYILALLYAFFINLSCTNSIIKCIKFTKYSFVFNPATKLRVKKYFFYNFDNFKFNRLFGISY